MLLSVRACSSSQGFNVLHAEVPMTPDNKSRGFALAEMETVAEAKRAVKFLNDREMEGRPLFCKIDER